VVSARGRKEIDFPKAEAMSLAARLELRQREAKPIFMDVGQLIATMRKDVLPKSPFAGGFFQIEISMLSSRMVKSGKNTAASWNRL